MAGAVATITQLRDSDALKHIEELGAALQRGLAEQIDRSGLDAHVLGVPQMPFMRFRYTDDATRRKIQDAFYTETTRRGVLFHPNHHWYVNAAMTHDDIETALDATAAGFRAAEIAAHRD
jgi:glutamate-1-semialdehyde aminotransferase